MEQAPTPNAQKILIDLELNHKKYILEIISGKDSMTMNLSSSEDDCISYTRNLTLKDLKDMSQFFALINSCQDFSVNLKKLAEEKKLSLNKKMNKIDLCFTLEYFTQKQLIEISLFIGCGNDSHLEERIKKLEAENKELKKEIEELKKIIEPIQKKFNESVKINRHIFNNNSTILQNNEFDLIHLAIKSRLNKEVKELKKLYQATVDGDGPINFHSRCDNIPNTLVLIKSAGNRRFGGFASEIWESPTSAKYKDDKNSFLFSLDKQKIYSYKNDGNALECYQNYGPCFGCGFTIGVYPHPIQEKKLYTYETYEKSSYNFYGDKNALSESGSGSWIYASEIEVFQVILES